MYNEELIFVYFFFIQHILNHTKDVKDIDNRRRADECHLVHTHTLVDTNHQNKST